MRIGRNEIIEQLTEHMRKVGGEAGEWCVGTAKHDGGFKIQGLRETAAELPELAHCEAHTAYAAVEALEYLVDAFGLCRDRNSCPGNIVHIYCPATTGDAVNRVGVSVNRVGQHAS